MPRKSKAGFNPLIVRARAMRDKAQAEFVATVREVQKTCSHTRVVAATLIGSPRYGRLCLDCGLEEHSDYENPDYDEVFWPGDERPRKRKLKTEFVMQVGANEFFNYRLA